MNKLANIISIEERRMIRDYIILGHILTMLQKELSELKYTKKHPEPSI